MKRKIALIILLLLLPLPGGVLAQGQCDGFIISNADDSTCHLLSGSAALNPDLPSRFVVQYSNGMKFYHLAPFPVDPDLSARFVIQYANVNRFYLLNYPLELIGDTTPPQVTGTSARSIGQSSARIAWTTQEYTTSRLEYGTQSGVYPHVVVDDLFRLQHEVTLTGLTAGQLYFYRIRSTDRSGNTGTSSQAQFALSTFIFLPLTPKR